MISAWAAFIAVKAQIDAAEAEVAAEQIALAGVIEERNVGQRTTLDVLNEQESLLVAQEKQILAQRDSVVAAYTLLAAMGGLDAVTLKLRVHLYDPAEHYELVKGKWYGLRTPDGR